MTRNFVPLYNITQNEYYAHALARANQDLLQNDWFTQTQLKHIVFSWMVEGLYHLNIIQLGTHIIQIILEAIFFISAFFISESTFSLLKKRNENLSSFDTDLLSLITIFTLIVIHNSTILIGLANRFRSIIPDAHHLWREFSNFSGVAVQVMNGGYLQPSEFGIFIMVAIALVLRSHWRMAVIMLAISVNFHFSYSIHCGVLLLVFAGFLLYEKRYQRTFEICVIFGVLVLPITLYAVSFLGDPLSEFASEIFAVEMFPFHSLPSVFWNRPTQMNSLKMITILLGIIFCWRFQFYRLISILLIGFIFIILGLLYVQATSDYSIAILFPWRASIYLVPLAIIIILICIIWTFSIIFHDHLLRKRWFQYVAIFFLVSILAGEGFMFLRWKVVGVTYSQDSVNPQQIYDKISGATDPSDVILIPSQQDENKVLSQRFWSGARMGMQRAVYVDGFSFPMLGKDVKEFWKRLQFIKSFDQQPLEIQRKLCREADVDYFVSYEVNLSLDITPIVEADPVYLYICE